MAKTYHLSFSGDEQASFTADCEVSGDGGATSLRLEGRPPHEQEVTGDGLVCRMTATGRVVVDITHDGGRSRSATNGGNMTFRLR
jgi:hypothetical protein